jgi:membrane-bound ClpP family serine protease
MTDPVTNALAVQLEYGEEELKQQIRNRIEAVAEEAAMIRTEEVAERMVRTYLQLHGQEILNSVVTNIVETKLQQFTNNSNYINNHSHLIKQLATTATQDHLRASMRQLLGATTLY